MSSLLPRASFRHGLPFPHGLHLPHRPLRPTGFHFHHSLLPMDGIESDWRCRTAIPSSKRWVLIEVDRAPKRQTLCRGYDKKKDDILKKEDNYWCLLTKTGRKEIILARDAFKRISKEWEKGPSKKKPFVRDFLARFGGVRKSDLEWLIDKLRSRNRPRLAQLPGKPPSPIWSPELTWVS
jgi:hypothetical protein